MEIDTLNATFDADGLMSDPAIVSALANVRAEFARDSKEDFFPRFRAAMDAADEWRFSTGEYFNRLPYEDERQGYSSPRLLKKAYAPPESARFSGQFASGFAAEKHLITIRPEETGIDALSCALHECLGDERRATNLTFRRFSDPGRRTCTLTSKRLSFWHGRSLLFVVAGAFEAFSVYRYNYSEEKVLTSADVFSKGWSQESHWTYHHENGELTRIRTGDVVLWSRSGREFRD